MFRARFLLLMPLLLAGCDVPLPLPLTPVQVIQGAWPPKTDPVAVAVAAQRNYTIKADTFAFPALGFSVTRASEQAWEFVPGNNQVAVETRDTTSAVRPTLTIAFIALPPGTDVPAQIKGDEQNLLQKGAKIAACSPARSVSGVRGPDVTFTQTDPQSGLSLVSEHVYLLLGQTLVLLQLQATQDNYNALQADFNKMIASIVLPSADAAAQATSTATPTSDGACATASGASTP